MRLIALSFLVLVCAPALAAQDAAAQSRHRARNVHVAPAPAPPQDRAAQALRATPPALEKQAGTEGANLGLSAALGRAFEHSPGFRAAQDRYAAAMETKPQAWSYFWPQLTASANYSHVDEHVSGTFYNLTDIDRTAVFNRPLGRVELTEPIFRRDLMVRLDQAQVVASRATAQLADARHELLIQLAEAYFGLEGAREALGAARAEKNAITEQLSQVRDKHAAGLNSDAELAGMQAQADLSSAREIQAENLANLARTHLERVIGQRVAGLRALKPDAVLPAVDPEVIETWVNRAWSGNLKLADQTMAVRLAELEVKRKSAGHLPTLDLVGADTYYDADDSLSGKRQFNEASIGVTLTLPLFSGFRVNSETRQAAHELAGARELERAQRDTAEETTRADFLNLLAHRARADALKQAVTSADSALDAMEVGYDVGTRTSVDVLDAIKDRTDAQRDYQGARFQYLLSWLKLRRDAGVLSAADFDTIDRILAP